MGENIIITLFWRRYLDWMVYPNAFFRPFDFTCLIHGD